MSRSPAPPGPPPPNYRPPGAPARAPHPLLGAPLEQVGADQRGPSGAGPGAVTAVAVTTLLLGLVVGFFLGRIAEGDGVRSSAPPLTSPASSTTRPPGDTIPQRPPGDPGAPPSTDLDPETIGTIDDPIPAGQAYVLGLFEIEVRRVDRDADATLQEFDPVNPPPPAGSQHLIIEVAVRSTDGSGLASASSIPLFVGDGESRWTDVEAQCGIVPDSILDTAPLPGGEQVVANSCFTVPIDVVDDVLLGTEGVNGALYFELPE